MTAYLYQSPSLERTGGDSMLVAVVVHALRTTVSRSVQDGELIVVERLVHAVQSSDEVKRSRGSCRVRSCEPGDRGSCGYVSGSAPCVSSTA